MTKLRSDEWYAGGDRNAYLHLAWVRRAVPSSAPSRVVRIANTASDLTPCIAHLDEVAGGQAGSVRGRAASR